MASSLPVLLGWFLVLTTLVLLLMRTRRFGDDQARMARLLTIAGGGFLAIATIPFWNDAMTRAMSTASRSHENEGGWSATLTRLSGATIQHDASAAFLNLGLVVVAFVLGLTVLIWSRNLDRANRAGIQFKGRRPA
jgi:ABC-type transport system involved in cytochrome c biogenesis permease subunit